MGIKTEWVNEMNELELLPVSEFSRLSESDCEAIQNRLAGLVIQQNRMELDQIKTVAGVDIAYWNAENNSEYAVCCIVVIDAQNKTVIEKKSAWGKSEFPYISGCLAFRELPLVIEAAIKLEKKPDLFMFDGNGILHTRGLGLAAHASFYLDSPTVGVAKHYFKIDEAGFIEPGTEAGSRSDIVKNGKIIGRVIRTKQAVKPIYVSVGNFIDIDTASESALKFVDKESHIPVPTRLADLETHIKRSEIKAQQNLR